MERPPHPRITWWAVGILFAGLLAAEIVYFVAAREEAADAAASMTHTKVYRHNMELVGGKAAVLAGGVAEWFASLWHGRTLAYTIAVVTVLIAGACFIVGWLQTPPRSD